MIKDVKKNSIILLLITIVVLFFILKDDFVNIVNILCKSNVLFILICLVVTFFFYFFKALSIHAIMKKEKVKITFKTALKQVIIVQFFNGVTPFATGGQPMHIYMITKEKVPVSKATSSVLMDFLSYQIAIILYCIVTLFLDFKMNLFSGNTLARNLVYLGFAINLFVCAVASIVSFSQKITSLLMKLVKKILKKKQSLDKIELKVSEFHEGTKSFVKDKKLFIKCLFLNVVGLTFHYVVPFFVVYAVNGNYGISITNSIIASSYVFLVGAFVPIPGGSGGVEYGFIQFFGNWFIESNLKAILLLWRSVTYYFGIVLGGILFGIKKRGDVK